MNILQVVVNKIKSLLGPITVPVNDPAVPLVINTTIPPLPQPAAPFAVQGFTGKDGPAGSLEHQAALTYTFIVHGLKTAQERSGLSLDKWARTSNLVVMPRAGNQLNAYYDGASLRFFYARGRDGKMVYTCESSDVVSHELGHAILDIIRPDIWTVASPETLAMHESFGDMMAMMAALAHPEVKAYVLQETKGDLHHPNIVSRLAEELGMAIGTGNALRNAINTFTYLPAAKLPANAPDARLSREPHSYSRVFTAAFYDALVNQYETYIRRQVDDPLGVAASDIGTALFRGIAQAANVPAFMPSVARAVLLADTQHGGVCRDALAAAFQARGLVTPLPAAATAVAMSAEGHRFAHPGGVAVRRGGTKSVRLCDKLILPQSVNPLYAVHVDVPAEHYVEYDLDGNCIGEIPVDDHAILTSTKLALDHIHEADKVSYDTDGDHRKEFAVVDGRLVRNYICCAACKHE